MTRMSGIFETEEENKADLQLNGPISYIKENGEGMIAQWLAHLPLMGKGLRFHSWKWLQNFMV